MQYIIKALIVGGLALFLVGCGSRHGATVNGKVTLDGEPLPDNSIGTVAFFPSGGGPPAVGGILEGGKYKLSTGRSAGLIPGDYSVTIGANEKPATMRGENGGPPPSGKPLTPVRYRSGRTSGLVYTVSPGGNTIDIELTSDEN